ncbi:hypothetical protein [Nocardia australiensis]|uniref:hypothetical protein n=1 Tax=Nocardia australiensis TaxID=2887191 RepID=UPI001D13ECEF|nr:hypothetical protein [Nocardia australiensis]
MPAARLDEHLSQCPDCRRWYAAVTESPRQLRLAPAPLVPDLGERIHARGAPPFRVSGRRRTSGAPRMDPAY